MKIWPRGLKIWRINASLLIDHLILEIHEHKDLFDMKTLTDPTLLYLELGLKIVLSYMFKQKLWVYQVCLNQIIYPSDPKVDRIGKIPFDWRLFWHCLDLFGVKTSF